MRRLTATVLVAAFLLLAGSALGQSIKEEHVTGGTLDQTWIATFGLTNPLEAMTLMPGDPGYSNPSGDHTVGVATNSAAPAEGGLVKTITDPAGFSDYIWEGWIFTGDGNTRRGLVVRSSPATSFTTCYQFVIESGLLTINFRKLGGMSATNLASWLTTDTPGGFPSTNSWHHMKIIADGPNFRLFWDGFELTTTPIVDAELTEGWVGVYNFRFDLGHIPFLVDDLILSPIVPLAAKETTWGRVKALYDPAP